MTRVPAARPVRGRPAAAYAWAGRAVLHVEFSVPGSVPVDAVIEYRVHYEGARGARAPKVFTLTRRRIEPGEPLVIARRHAFVDVSVRRHRPGPHTIDVQVNGRLLGSLSVHLTDGGGRPCTESRTPS